ncbi:glycosyltransferase [Sphingobacterium sp. UBA5670]|uniref:glycosyltransferase n=1 Tax=Sphingobacterium sp. UBA5670 TaxID=1947502 RepID=UPI0025F6A350|nr:glycosyltransferase [Sphingobacterium sp. UBA5670]
MKRFITIFPNGTNIHLVKDVGMVPYFLQKEGYYKSSIACYERREDMGYLDNEVHGLSYYKIRRIFDNENLNIFIFLLFHLRRFDVVMFFHQSFIKTLVALFVKAITFNRVKFYFKLDANDSIKESKLAKSTGLWRRFKVYLYNKIDLISVETQSLKIFFNSNLALRVAYIPNGFDFDKLAFVNGRELTEYKENRIVLVGRIGAPEKDNLTMLKALAEIDLGGWEVEFIGPIAASFEQEIVRFFAQNPGLKSKVLFTGAVMDRNMLLSKLRRSKVFVQTSKFESFGIALLEGVSCGCYVVSTDLTPAQEIAGPYGLFFEIGNFKKLAVILQSIIDVKIHLPSEVAIISRAEQEFSWSFIAKKIHACLNS